MRKAWNIPIQTVYSLLTYDASGNANMNICTYVTGVSMQPKRFVIAVYKNTKTLDNLSFNQTVVLQVLNEVHAPLVKLLGKQSGKKIDKMSRLRKRDCLQTIDECELLKCVNAYLRLAVVDSFDVGDHILYTFDLVKSRSFSEANILTNQYLMEHGHIL
ncbi:MAG: flavin reductase [Chitinophagales bacterium]|nr:flavin reductase [Chitinophagales bacterium]